MSVIVTETGHVSVQNKRSKATKDTKDTKDAKEKPGKG